MTELSSQSKKKFRKWPIVILAVLLSLGVAGLLLYKKIIAYTISNAIVKEEEPSPLLGSYGTEVRKFRAPINKASEQIIYKLDSLHIPFESFLTAVDNADKTEILQTLDAINEQKPETPNEVFNIVKKNMTVKEFDIELFRKPFLRYASMPKINKALNYIESHKLAEEIDISISREIIKTVLRQKKDEITQKLKASGGITTD